VLPGDLGVPAHLTVVPRARANLLAGQCHGELVTGVDRGEEAQVVEAVIREYRTRVRLDEQARREGQDQVAVSDAAVEERVGRRGLLVHVRVERVPGELGEM